MHSTDIKKDQIKIPIVFSESLFSTNPEFSKIYLSDLETLLTTHQKISKKIDSPLLFFGKMVGGIETKNVEYISAFILDLDNKSIKNLPEICKSFYYIAYTTYSHSEIKEAWRVVFPLEKTIDSKKIKYFWEKFNFWTNAICDQICKNINRRWYLPSAPNLNLVRYIINEGKFLNEEILESVVIKKITEVYGADEKRIFDVKEIIRKISKQNKIYKNLMLGKPFAEKGERRITLRNITYSLARRYKNPLSLEDIKIIFGDSLESMEDSCEDAYRAYSDALKKIDEDDKYERLQKLGVDRLYTDDEMKVLADSVGVKDLKHWWILNFKGENLFLDCSGKYRGPYTQNGFPAACREYLSRAPVNFLGQDPITIKGDHSSNIISIHYDIRTNKDKIQEECLISGIKKNQAIESKYDENIAHWLYLLCEEKQNTYEIFLKILAIFSDLSRPCPVVALRGPKDVGKSLLANGLSRLFCSRGPTSIHDVIGDFNEDLLECPLVCADEGLPSGRLKKDPTEWLREHSVRENHPLNAKFKSNIKLLGYLRFILNGNETFFRLKKSASKDTLQALAQRIFFLEIKTNKASEFIQSLPTDEINRWEKEGIAAHSLYLKKEIIVDRECKVTVKVSQKESFNMLCSSSTTEDMNILYEIIVKYISGEIMDISNATDAIIVRNKKLYINTPKIAFLMNLYGGKKYSYRFIGRLIKTSLSTGEKIRIRKQTDLIYNEINMDVLRTWIQDTEVWEDSILDTYVGKNK